MNTKQLNYFIRAAECGSIAAAGRELDIAQPAISQQIANLEHELKASLFDRDFRGVRLTESGKKFLSYAQSIMRQIEQAKTDISEAETNPVGTVAIGMGQSIGNVLSVPLMAEAEALYPNIKLDLYTGLSYTVHDWVRQGEIDLAISCVDGGDMSNLNKVPLICEKIYLAMSANPKTEEQKKLLLAEHIHFRDLAKHEVIVTGRKEALGYTLHQYEQKTGIEINKIAPFGQLMTTLRILSEGYAMLVIPSSAIFHLEEIGQVKSLEIIEPCMTRKVFMITSTNRPLTNATRTVMKLIEKVSAEANMRSQWRGEMLCNPQG